MIPTTKCNGRSDVLGTKKQQSCHKRLSENENDNDSVGNSEGINAVRNPRNNYV